MELSIALHRVFQTPKDKFLFDVSHQGYVHKLLTGRADRFSTIRQYDANADRVDRHIQLRGSRLVATSAIA
ncbi:MAG TPA: 1-deoxy-D-xylulose-5-phosphate synthase N-terminal domain-containing protein [Pirellulaceae bacterium]|nr:1-deoxy-D-xylulose-5-phosphate synthase N-terminal domain-containing protein [Pirellulaceae bacterium]